MRCKDIWCRLAYTIETDLPDSMKHEDVVFLDNVPGRDINACTPITDLEKLKKLTENKIVGTTKSILTAGKNIKNTDDTDGSTRIDLKTGIDSSFFEIKNLENILPTFLPHENENEKKQNEKNSFQAVFLLNAHGSNVTEENFDPVGAFYSKNRASFYIPRPCVVDFETNSKMSPKAAILEKYVGETVHVAWIGSIFDDPNGKDIPILGIALCRKEQANGSPVQWPWVDKPIALHRCKENYAYWGTSDCDTRRGFSFDGNRAPMYPGEYRVSLFYFCKSTWRPIWHDESHFKVTNLPPVKVTKGLHDVEFESLFPSVSQVHVEQKTSENFVQVCTAGRSLTVLHPHQRSNNKTTEKALLYHFRRRTNAKEFRYSSSCSLQDVSFI